MRKVTFFMVAALLTASAVQAQPRWYKSKKFWIPFVTDVAAGAADFYNSQRLFAQGGYETDPLFGAKRPGFARMEAMSVPAEMLFYYTTYRMSNGRFKAAVPVLDAIPAGEHAYFAWHNDTLLFHDPKGQLVVKFPVQSGK